MLNLDEQLRRGVTAPLLKVGKELYGLGPAATYAAADAGDIPSIRAGKKRLALLIPIRRELRVDEPPGALGHDGGPSLTEPPSPAALSTDHS